VSSKGGIKAPQCTDEKELRSIINECFNKFDKNGDGRIDLSEVTELVKYSQTRGKENTPPLSHEHYRDAAIKLMEMIGKDQHRMMDREDFYHFYKKL